jgi:hypothetical protein
VQGVRDTREEEIIARSSLPMSAGRAGVGCCVHARNLKREAQCADRGRRDARRRVAQRQGGRLPSMGGGVVICITATSRPSRHGTELGRARGNERGKASFVVGHHRLLL